MYHKVTVVGHVGRDPEMRYTPDGTAVTSFSVATTRKWNTPSGTPGQETVWFRVSAWRKLAETCNTYVKKGMLVLVEGTIKPDANTGGPRIFTRSDGTSGSSYELTAQVVRFLSGRGEAVPSEAPAGGAEPPLEEEDPGAIPF